ncbi:hypothetical protein [Rhodospirillaceae bacterium SYSU D60014]|uniref:hypothetical protein n=1 Tax=Virgifigura deserti TaxID=2268457 RepID=UPI000E663A20
MATLDEILAEVLGTDHPRKSLYVDFLADAACIAREAGNLAGEEQDEFLEEWQQETCYNAMAAGMPLVHAHFFSSAFGLLARVLKDDIHPPSTEPTARNTAPDRSLEGRLQPEQTS